MGRELRRRALVMILVVAGVAALPAAAQAAAGPSLWTRASDSLRATRAGQPRAIDPQRFRAFSLDRAGMLAALKTAPAPRSTAPPLLLSLPAPRGGFQSFAVRSAPVMSAQLQRKYPDMLSLAGRGVSDRNASVRVTFGPLGFAASVRGSQGSWYVDRYYQRDQSRYVTYFGRDLKVSPKLAFVERDLPKRDQHLAAAPSALPPTSILRTYRLALLSNPDYARFFSEPGDDQATVDAKVLAAKNELMSRVDQVYEDELAIRMVMIDDTDSKLDFDTDAEMTGANGPCGGAPCFSADDPTTPDDPADGSAAFCGAQTLEDTATTLGQVIGASNFDIGHLALGNDGGGIAELGVVGNNLKSWGCTGIPTPVGDFYAIDYVAHEMGHQFGANHTFNGNTWNCGFGNRNGPTSVEPGSGSSIMAYAGICRQDNLQPHSDPYFSQRSFDEITGYTSSNQPAVDEVQNVGLSSNFGGSDSFKVTYNGQASTLTVTRGVNYNNAGILAAIESIPGFPDTAVTVDRFGHSGDLDNDLVQPVDDRGFQVTFNGPNLGGTNVPGLIGVTSLSGFSGFVAGETESGGPAANQGDTAQSTGDQRPAVTVPPTRFIPTRTPFSLTGSATDADHDGALSYMWEQNDIGHDDGTQLTDNNKLDGPLFRQFGVAAQVTDDNTLLYHSPGENIADANPTRVFPDMGQILAGTTNQATGACPAPPPDEDPTDGQPAATPVPLPVVDCYSEFLPTAAYVGDGDRTLHFRLTVRDHQADAGGLGPSGAIGRADTALRVVPTAGPFRVTFPTAGSVLDGGGPETVTWDVARTNLPPLSVGNVRITMSRDGGATFPDVLAASTPNDGSQAVTMPSAASSAVRIRVEAIGNTFFDVSHGDATLGSRHAQYSDAIAPTTIAAHDAGGDGSKLTATAGGLPSGLALTANAPSAGGTRTFTIAGTVTAAPGTYPVVITITDGSGAKRQVAYPIVVLPEDATAKYTGDRAAERKPGLARLAARVAEVPDGSPGDIGRATVTFSQRGKVLCGGPVAVTRRADGTGTASCAARLGGGKHRVAVTVGGYYTAATNRRLAGANPALCGSAVGLTRLSRSNGKVRISGFAERRFAGRRVTLYANGRRVARPRVRSGGGFSARVKAPRGRDAGTTSYTAEIAGRLSPAVELGRRLQTSVEGRRVRGRLTGSGHAGRRLVVRRALDCTSSHVVKRVRTSRTGRFSVLLPRPPKGTTAVFHVRTASGKPRSSSLPVVIVRK